MKAVAVGPEQTLELRERPRARARRGRGHRQRRGLRDLRLRPPHAALGRARRGLGDGPRVRRASSPRSAPASRAGARASAVCVYPFAPLEHLDIAAAMASGIGLGTNDGGYAERVAVPAEMLWRLPEGVELAHGALVEPLAVALHGIDVSGAEPGSSRSACSAAGRSARWRGRRCGPAASSGSSRSSRTSGAGSWRERLGASAALGLEGVHEAVDRGARRRRPRSCSSAPATSRRPTWRSS